MPSCWLRGDPRDEQEAAGNIGFARCASQEPIHTVEFSRQMFSRGISKCHGKLGKKNNNQETGWEKKAHRFCHLLSERNTKLTHPVV